MNRGEYVVVVKHGGREAIGGGNETIFGPLFHRRRPNAYDFLAQVRRAGYEAEMRPLIPSEGFESFSEVCTPLEKEEA